MGTTYDYDISLCNTTKLYTSQTLVNILKQSRLDMFFLNSVLKLHNR